MGVSKTHLRVINGGKLEARNSPKKENVIFCFYTDRNGRKAIFCEAKKYTVIYTFYSSIVNKYAILSLSANKRFRKIKEANIPSEWEKTIASGDIGPKHYGRSLLADTYDEAVLDTFMLLRDILCKAPVEMPDSEVALCVSQFTYLFTDFCNEFLKKRK